MKRLACVSMVLLASATSFTAQADTRIYRVDFNVDPSAGGSRVCLDHVCADQPADLTPLRATVTLDDTYFAIAASDPVHPVSNIMLRDSDWRFDDLGLLTPPGPVGQLAQVFIAQGQVVDFGFQLGEDRSVFGLFDFGTFVALDGRWIQQRSLLTLDTGPRDGVSTTRQGTYIITQVPEPSTYALLVAGLAGLTVAARRRRAKQAPSAG